MAPGKVGGILANDRYPLEFLMSNLTITQRMGGAYLRKFGKGEKARCTWMAAGTSPLARFERLTCLTTPCASSVDKSLDADPEGCASQNARVNDS